MQKLLKRSLSIVLAVMMVVTMFAGSFVSADTGEVIWRSMDWVAGVSGSPDRPEPTLETGNYLEGAGALRYDLSGRTKTDLFWYGDNAGSALTATTDITAAIDADGKTVWAFDLYVSDAAAFIGSRTIFSIMSYASSADSQDVNSMKAWISVDTSTNAAWNVDFGLADGLKNGWNHIAIAIDTDEGDNKYADASYARADFWDASKVWKFRLLNEGATAVDNQIMIIDDVRFMTPAYYASSAYTSDIAVKEVVALINDIDGKDDTEGMAAAAAAYAALSESEQAQVFNYDKYVSYTSDAMVASVHTCDSSTNTIMAAGFSKWVKTSLNRTEGKYSMRGTAPDGTVSIHFSFQIPEGMDFSQADYLVFDFYYTGLSFNWINGQNDQNIGLGPSTTWHDMGYGNITNAAMQTYMMSQIKPDQWNHVVIPLTAFNLTSEQLVYNVRFYWEGCVVANAGTNQIWIDDIRIANANGLEEIVPETNAGKDLAQTITGLTVDNTDGIAAAKASYEALSNTAKAAVYNASTLTDLAEAPALASAFDAKVNALAAGITYANKADVEALRAEYAALSATAQGIVTTLPALESMEATIAAEAEKIAAVEATIAALPAEIDLSHKGLVEAARAAVEELAADTKAGVANLDVLEAAEAKINELEQAAGDAEKAAAVDAAIAALKDAADITVDDEAAINAAEAMYNALNDDQKALVQAANVEKLAAVKAALAQDKADREAAAAVDATIAALPETVVVADKAAVEAARAAYEALNDKAKSYVANLAVLEADEAAIAVLEAAIIAAKAVEEQIAALPETITADDAAAVEAARAAYRELNATAKALVPNLAVLEAAEVAIACSGAYDTTFRSFETALSDLACAGGGTSPGIVKSGLVGKRAFQVSYDGSASAAELHMYVYSFNQNTQNDDELNNVDGSAKLIVTDPSDMYVTFDLYVSDASVLANATGDIGFCLDTAQTGGKNNWGNAGTTKASIIRPILKELVDGWNHVVIPLTLSGAYKLEDGGQRAIKAGDVLTVEDFRFHVLGLTIPAEGFTVLMDDVHFMNGAGVAEINTLRNIAKDVTIAIENYADDATYDDFFAIYSRYASLPEEYQAITKGWDEFVAANADFAAQADEQFPADSAVAEFVDSIIAPLTNVTLDDEAEVVFARAVYDRLTETQKNMVLKADILVAAEQTIENLKIEAANKAAANAVDEMIAALPTDDMTIADKADVEAARAAYTALTVDQKLLVKNLMALRAAENKIAEIEVAMAAAKAVDDMIAALPGVDTVSEADAEAVAAARAAYADLSEAAQAYVTNLDVLEAIEYVLANPAPKYTLGDVNEDGKVDAGDALEVLKYAVGKAEFTDIQKLAGDVNTDGKIDAGDALEILKIAVGKSEAA